jgi:hypothetical protein
MSRRQATIADFTKASDELTLRGPVDNSHFGSRDLKPTLEIPLVNGLIQ